MSQYPPQPYPQQGPPMGGPPMYAPPPKKTGIVLLILGLLGLVIGGILTIIGIAGFGKMAADAQAMVSGTSTFVAPGESTMTLSAGEHFIMSLENMDVGGTVYSPTDAFPTTATVFSVKAADGTDVPVTQPSGQGNFNSGQSSGEVVRQFSIPTAGSYTVSVTNPDGMEQRAIGVLSMEQLMGIAGGAMAGLGGLACGAPLAIIGIILIIVWVIVRK